MCFHEFFSTKTKSIIFIVNLKWSAAKQCKTIAFSRIFSTKKFVIFFPFQVINRETPKTKPLTAPPPVNTAPNEEPVQLRRGQQSRASASSSSNNKKKQCRVLFSYQPQHEDELELKMEDVVDFVAEVEDGWWKGKLRGRVGVFPSNFVEMIKNHANVNNEDAEQTVQDKNKRNEKLKSGNCPILSERNLILKLAFLVLFPNYS